MSDLSLKLGLQLKIHEMQDRDEKHKKHTVKLPKKKFLDLKNLEVQAAFITPSKHDHRRLFPKQNSITTEQRNNIPKPARNANLLTKANLSK